MKHNDTDLNKLTDRYLSPLEAHRLATNLKMLEQARKEQKYVPWQINAFILLVLFFYVLFSFLYNLGIFEFLKTLFYSLTFTINR